MACTGFRHPLQCLIRDVQSKREIAAFLVPSISPNRARRQYSRSTIRRSRIGMEPISIPEDVSIKFMELPSTRSRHVDAAGSIVEITGPQGSQSLNLPAYLATDYDASNRKMTVSVKDRHDKHQKSMWGTMRSHIQNSISGVSEGHICILRMVGVGYRATIEDKAITKEPQYTGQKFVSLKLGFAHPVELGVPQGVKATVPQPTRILLEGSDKQTVTQFAAEIRAWRKPEPYKGKGIFVNDETIKLKAKKIK